VGFDVRRWYDASARHAATPVESAEYPGRRFMVLCSDVARAVATLSRGDGRMLAALAWRGT
jgi:hypothetical protein